MKKYIYILLSLFLIFIAIFFIQNNKTINNPLDTHHSLVTDSLSNYYQTIIRRIDTTPNSIKIVDDFIKTTTLLNIDSLKYKSYNIKIKLLDKTKRYKEFKQVCKQLLKLAQDADAKKYIAKAAYKLANRFQEEKKLVTSFTYFNESFKASRDLNSVCTYSQLNFGIPPIVLHFSAL